jgi:N-acetylmuramoyl-L-alanine amidase
VVLSPQLTYVDLALKSKNIYSNWIKVRLMITRTSQIKTRALEYTQEAEALIRKKDQLVKATHENFLDFSQLQKLIQEERALVKRINVETKEVIHAIETRIDRSSDVEFFLLNIRSFYKKLRNLFAEFLRVLRSELLILNRGEIGSLDGYLDKELEVYYKIERLLNSEAHFLSSHDLIITPIQQNRIISFKTLKSPVAKAMMIGFLLLSSTTNLLAKDNYITRKGDTWYSIGKKFGVSYEWLAGSNGMNSNNILPVGIRLNIPVGKTSGTIQKTKEKYDFLSQYKNRAPGHKVEKRWQGVSFKTANYAVTKYTKHPSILIEWYFLSNSDEYREFNIYENYLLSSVVRSIADYMAKTGAGTIILDAGHGGRDGGAENRKLNVKEKDETLKIAKILERAFNNAGIAVRMIRSSDTFVDVDQRWQEANKFKGNAIFVSLHLNSAKNPNAHGYEVFCYDPARDDDHKRRGNRDPERIKQSEALAAYVVAALDTSVARLPSISPNMVAQNR